MSDNVRDAALEEAAKIVDMRAESLKHYQNTKLKEIADMAAAMRSEALSIAAKIRNLKSNTEAHNGKHGACPASHCCVEKWQVQAGHESPYDHQSRRRTRLLPRRCM
jgi:hypothetical protein